jgi:AcrR family transcriptional regulator
MPRRYRSSRRAQAVEETRRRILLATMELHGEQGILATSWEDIARRAGVALATVYRHFPTLHELVPACGARAEDFIRPPRAELAETLFTDADDLATRVGRVVAEMCAFYERGAVALATARREGHAVEPLGAWARELDRTRELLVHAALAPAAPDERTARVAAALTAFPVWQALTEGGVPAAEAPRVIHRLVLCSLGEAG